MTVGPWPARIRLWSLPKETSLRRWRRFSIAQWPRRSSSRRAAGAASGGRLVTPKRTARLAAPPSRHVRSSRKTWAAPGQSR